MAILMDTQVFLDFMPYRLVFTDISEKHDVYHSETSVIIHRLTSHNIQEDKSIKTFIMCTDNVPTVCISRVQTVCMNCIQIVGTNYVQTVRMKCVQTTYELCTKFSSISLIFLIYSVNYMIYLTATG